MECQNDPQLTKQAKRLYIIVGICIMATAVGVASGVYLGADNFIEQGAEAVIKQESGVVIDLTPPIKK
jgi:hypothetical protein